MKPEYIYAFYEFVILPQFGVDDKSIGWRGSKQIGPDETAHFCSTAEHDYVLIFEDYDGLGRNPDYLEETLKLNPEEYMLVPAKARSRSSSLYFLPEAPYKYAPNFTGSFTLLRLASKSDDKRNLLHLNIENNWGWVQAAPLLDSAEKKA